MARLFALLGNRSDLVGRVLQSESNVLRARSAGKPLGWGIGFYQAGEVLLRRRPIDNRPEIDIASYGEELRGDIVLGHVRTATVGALSTQNTHPFRYREWLFAQTGTLDAFDLLRDRLLESLPEFLRGAIQGETDAEIVFCTFLSFLHDQGVLSSGTAGGTEIADALRSTLALLDGMLSEQGRDRLLANLVVSNGERVVFAHRRGELAVRVLSGRTELEPVLGDEFSQRRKSTELDLTRFVLLASDFDEPPPPPWRTLPCPCIVELSRGADPRVETLS